LYATLDTRDKIAVTMSMKFANLWNKLDIASIIKLKLKPSLLTILSTISVDLTLIGFLLNSLLIP